LAGILTNAGDEDSAGVLEGFEERVYGLALGWLVVFGRSIKQGIRARCFVIIVTNARTDFETYRVFTDLQQCTSSGCFQLEAAGSNTGFPGQGIRGSSSPEILRKFSKIDRMFWICSVASFLD
jgi:hypothetical protein